MMMIIRSSPDSCLCASHGASPGTGTVPQPVTRLKKTTQSLPRPATAAAHVFQAYRAHVLAELRHDGHGHRDACARAPRRPAAAPSLTRSRRTQWQSVPVTRQARYGPSACQRFKFQVSSSVSVTRIDSEFSIAWEIGDVKLSLLVTAAAAPVSVSLARLIDTAPGGPGCGLLTVTVQRLLAEPASEPHRLA